MSTLFLITPNASYADDIVKYREEFIKTQSLMNGTGSLLRMEDPFEWLAEVDALSRIETLPQNWVQSTQFMYIRETDHKIVGMIQVRHFLNDALKKFSGHIGYCVRPSERKKGYAQQMLHDCLPYCKKIGHKKVMITCASTNESSKKVILANGGVYENAVFEPKRGEYFERYWIDLS